MALNDIISKNDKIDEEVDLATHINECMTNTENRIMTIRQRMHDSWNEYRGNMDFSDKQDWQSTNHLPKFSQAVRITKNLMKQNIIKSDKFFVYRGTNEKTKDAEIEITEGLKKVVEQSKFKQKHFANGVFRGLLENLIIFKTWVEPLGPRDKKIHPQQTYKFPVSVVSALDLYIDPTGRGKFLIHKIRMDLSDYRRKVEAGIYEKDTLDAVIGDFRRDEEAYREAQEKGEHDISPPSWRKEVELLEYWGDVDNEMGETIHRNVTFTVVNEKYIARKPIKNPFEHGQPPFAIGPIFEVDGSQYHEGFGDHIIPITNMLNDFWRMTMDSTFASQMKAFEINGDLIDEPSQLASGIYPFKTIFTSGGMPGQNAVRDFTLGNTSPEALPMLASIDRELQNASGVNEFISGIVGAGDKTATEVKQKAGQSMGFMAAISEDIEDNVLTPYIEMTYSNVLQYNPELLGEKVNLLPKEDLEYNFEVRGMSKIMKQIEEFNNLFAWVGMMAKTPAGARIKWDEIAEKTARLRNFDPKDILVDPEQPGVQAPGIPQQGQQGMSPQQAILQAMQGGQKK